MSATELAQLSSLVTKLESNFGLSLAGTGGASVSAYDNSVGTKLSNFLQVSNDIGGDVVKIASLAQAAFISMRQVLLQAEKQPQPSGAALQAILQPLAAQIEAVQTFKNCHRTSPFLNHVSTIAESIGALGWVSVPDKPCPYVETMRDAGVFYSNRILKDYKGKPDADSHSCWVRTWTDLLNELHFYVKMHHLTGLVWGSSNVVITDCNMATLLDRLDVLVHIAKPSSRTSVMIEANGESRKSSSNVGGDVHGLDAAILLKVQRFTEISREIGSDVGEIASLVSQAFDALREFVLFAASNPKPTNFAAVPSFKKLTDAINGVVAYREKNRTSANFNHLSTLASSVSALGWVQVSPAPSPFVKEMADSGQFYSDKVLMQYKKTDQKHVDWVNDWKAIMTALEGYVKESHITGLVWSSKPAPAGGKGGPPPPPPPGGIPPPPPPPPAESSADADKEAAKRAELFAALNQGENITSRLKKVDDSQKTHKNPALRKAKGPPPVAPKPGSKQATTSPKKTVVSDKPPVLELKGNKWCVEFQKNNKGIVIDDTELKQTVYVYKCENSTIQVKGKINGITLDSCKKTALVFDELISTVDLVNCASTQLQCLQHVSTVSIDKSDGVQVYLSEPTSRTCKIVSAKSSEMNVCVTQPNGDLTEFALPEQYNHVWQGKGYFTEPSDI